METYIILTTTSSKKEAKMIAQTLLDHRLIACAQWNRIQSLYTFNGKTCHDKEYLLRLKTTKSALEETKKMLLAIHSYEVPQYLAIAIDEISQDYQDFIYQNIKHI